MTDHVDPQRAQFEMFKSLPRDEPILMLNLVCLNERAVYPDGRESSGVQAYKTYGETSGPIFTSLGGEIVWRGRPEVVLIGPADEHWDVAFIARYPNSGAFLAMVTNEEYKKVVVHRQAAVKTSRLIRMSELPVTPGFAD